MYHERQNWSQSRLRMKQRGCGTHLQTGGEGHAQGAVRLGRCLVGMPDGQLYEQLQCCVLRARASSMSKPAGPEKQWRTDCCRSQDGQLCKQLWCCVRRRPARVGAPIVPHQHQLQGQGGRAHLRVRQEGLDTYSCRKKHAPRCQRGPPTIHASCPPHLALPSLLQQVPGHGLHIGTQLAQAIVVPALQARGAEGVVGY